MLETMIDAIVSAWRATFLGGDRVSLVIAMVAILVAVSAMKRSTQIGSVTILALLLYVAGKYAYAVFARAPVVDDDAPLSPGARAASLVNQGWADLSAMSATTALAYFLAFMLVIWIVFALRSMVSFSPSGHAHSSAGHGGGH